MTDTPDAGTPREPNPRDYVGVNGSWRQCRWCFAYAEAPLSTPIHRSDCPVKRLEAVCACGHALSDKCFHCICEEYRQANPQGTTIIETTRIADEDSIDHLIEDIVGCADEMDGGKIDAERLCRKLVFVARRSRS